MFWRPLSEQKLSAFYAFLEKIFGIPSNSESKSQHDSNKELKYFFFSLGASISATFPNINKATFLKFWHEKFLVTAEKGISLALQTFGQIFD